jgi:hypothetical protein
MANHSLYRPRSGIAESLRNHDAKRRTRSVSRSFFGKKNERAEESSTDVRK